MSGLQLIIGFALLCTAPWALLMLGELIDRWGRLWPRRGIR